MTVFIGKYRSFLSLKNITPEVKSKCVHLTVFIGNYGSLVEGGQKFNF